MAFDIYAAVTDRIIEQLESGVIPWRKPWIGSGCAISYSTGKRYSLLNQILLQEPGEYLTFKQAKDAGGNVKKGAKSKMVVFWKMYETEDEKTGEKKTVPVLRYYNVFHISQCEGVESKHKLPAVAVSDDDAEDIISGYIARSGVKMLPVESDRAFYQPSADTVAGLHLVERQLHTFRADGFQCGLDVFAQLSQHLRAVIVKLNSHSGPPFGHEKTALLSLGGYSTISKYSQG